MWKVCIARLISPARNFDAFYIITIKFLKSPARNSQTFQSGVLHEEVRDSGNRAISTFSASFRTGLPRGCAGLRAKFSQGDL